MELLERQAELAVLHGCLWAARRDGGRLLIVQGEAGIGKSVLVRRFCEEIRGARVLMSMCDPLATPRAFGPMLDIADRLGVSASWGADVSREAVFAWAHGELRSRNWSTVLVIEDVHWADEATLDLLRFLGRRLDTVHGLVVVTCRDEELDAHHPLRTVIGDLAAVRGVSRLELGPLSQRAVSSLARGRQGLDVAALYRLTGGNPFFVTEVLAAGGAGVPATVRDAVLARASRLTAGGRAVVEAASITPTRIEIPLLETLAGVGADEIDAAVDLGVLRPDEPGTVSFRHELARLAVHETIPPARRAAMHAQAVTVLRQREGRSVDPARIAHHAEHAGETVTARTYAMRAAALAADLGAHREAAAQYERALRHAERLPDDQLADLLETYVEEARATDQVDTALEAATRAVQLRRQLGDPVRLGSALGVQVGALWSAGRSGAATRAAHEAVTVLQPLGASPELARAYAWLAAQSMLGRDHAATMAWGGRAIELAEQLEALYPLVRALNSVGTSKILNSDQRGVADLRRSISLAAAARLDDFVAMGWLNLGSGSGEVRDYATAEPALREAIAWARQRDLDMYLHYATVWLARVRFERGDWDEAERLVTGEPRTRPGMRPTTIVMLTVRGRLQTRRGDADPWPALNEAWKLATDTGDLQRLWPVAAARAEAAWLGGDEAAIPGHIDQTYRLARRLGHRWAVGELQLWQWRAGRPVADASGEAAEPYALHVAGRFRVAAARWQELGCPYEAADALADSDQPVDLRRALAVFDELAARPAAQQVRRRLRRLGERRVPRGPRRTTADAPAGLTPRQSEVLGLIAKGLSDAEIARKLYISPKTAGHHVSAVLAKLGVSSRGEAAHLGRRLGAVND
jgi:DNA-binding CsgD family transcriptional regulator/tetratricopeptide (TPR) repeat protein